MDRIALDMDEVIADVQPKFLDIYEEKMGRRISREEYRGKKIYDTEGAESIRDHLYDKGFFADLPVMPDSQEVVRELLEDYEIFIVTAAMEFQASLEDKYNWLQKHFPFLHWKNFVFCGDKSIIRADYMIDDHPRNLRSFEGVGLLYTASHNVDETEFIRVDNWKDIRRFFRLEREKKKNR
ncbi:MAG: 5'(3')-deoxyribonucleotidase [Saprospiraceae bacterium]|nr:5'(3')-deoxyribonucleotidase [Saprospiraceae bacterium]